MTFRGSLVHIYRIQWNRTGILMIVGQDIELECLITHYNLIEVITYNSPLRTKVLS